MNLGFTEKAAKRIHLPSLPAPEFNEYSIRDWSVAFFFVNRSPHFLVMSANTLLSCVFYGNGINDTTSFIKTLSHSLDDLFEAYGQELIFRNFVEPRSHETFYFKSFSKSLIASLNSNINHIKKSNFFGDLTPLEMSIKLNQMPIGAINYASAHENFNAVIKRGI